MLSSGRLALLATWVFSCDALHLHTNASASVFMLVAGTTSTDEVCLIQNANKVKFDSCSSAVAAGDGREIWSLTGTGQLMSVASKKCASVSAGVSPLSMQECGGASPWKLLPNGQAQVGDACLSQTGEGAGAENVAVHAAVVATSSASSAAHAASAAVDADDATFWASKPGEGGPVAFTVDLGEVRSLDHLKIVWEYPAQSFAISISSEDDTWTEVFATAINAVKVSRVQLGLTTARKLRLEMRKPHPLDGAFSGQPVYGIRSLALFAPRLDVALEKCTLASQSKDARDKYFAVPISSFDLSASASLQAEVPALIAAKASLASGLSALASAFQGLEGCGGIAVERSAVRLSGQQRNAVREEAVGSMDDFDEADVRTLLASARSTIVGVRDAALQ